VQVSSTDSEKETRCETLMTQQALEMCVGANCYDCGPETVVFRKAASCTPKSTIMQNCTLCSEKSDYLTLRYYLC